LSTKIHQLVDGNGLPLVTLLTPSRHAEPDDQKGHRIRRGSRRGRPVGFDAIDYRNRNVIERNYTRRPYSESNPSYRLPRNNCLGAREQDLWPCRAVPIGQKLIRQAPRTWDHFHGELDKSMNEAIVVGVVDTDASRAAQVWALKRAARHELPVLLVHAIDERWITKALTYTDAIRTAAIELLSETAAHASELEPSVEVKTLLFPGSPGQALGKHSKGASMVVIGTGHDWPGGPVTDRALQIAAVARCPVAIIGEQDTTGRRGVVVGVDGSEESMQAVSFAATEADWNGQELTVLHAFLNPRNLRGAMPADDITEAVLDEEKIVLAETVAGLAENYPDLVVHQVLASEKEPAKALVEAAANASLLVLGSRGRGSFKRLLLGSTAHAVLTKLPCPTVITRVRRAKDIS
jgi:nucleotide-binding universal stress UspA family protein